MRENNRASRTYVRSVGTLLCRLVRTISSSATPAAAALVTKPARMLCPLYSAGSTPARAHARLTASATAWPRQANFEHAAVGSHLQQQPALTLLSAPRSEPQIYGKPGLGVVTK